MCIDDFMRSSFYQLCGALLRNILANDEKMAGEFWKSSFLKIWIIRISNQFWILEQIKSIILIKSQPEGLSINTLTPSKSISINDKHNPFSCSTLFILQIAIQVKLHPISAVRSNLAQFQPFSSSSSFTSNVQQQNENPSMSINFTSH